MSEPRVEMLEVLRAARRSASDLRKVFLALYGLLLFVPFSLLAIAAGRTVLYGDFGGELSKTFNRGAAKVVAFTDLDWVNWKRLGISGEVEAALSK